jgi:phosphonate metabolism protein (transferase hexapeptide repeat family)
MNSNASAGERVLSEQPQVDATAEIRESELGAWTAVGPRTTIAESKLGDYSYVMNDGNVIYSEIGKFCSIAAFARINPGNHPLGRAALHHFTYRSRSYQLAEDDDREFFEWRRSSKVTLGHDVWVGHGAVILPGVQIGSGAAIGAGAVVSKNVPPFAVVAGVPARVIRFRFEEDVREGLIELAWWNWPRERLAIALPDFRTLSVREFIAKYGG